MRGEFPEPSTAEHLLNLLAMGGFLLVGFVICFFLVTPLLRRHFRRMDEHPRWYER